MRGYSHFLILLSHVSEVLAVVDMKCSAESRDRSAVLTCVAAGNCEEQVTIAHLMWKRDSVPLVTLSENGIESKEPERFELKEEPWHADSWATSLQINNVKSQDKGRYSCSVITDCGVWKGSVYLDIPETVELPNPTPPPPPSADNGVIGKREQDPIPPAENTGHHKAALAGTVATLVVLIAVFVAVRKRHLIEQQTSRLRFIFHKRAAQAEEEQEQYTKNITEEHDPV
ncbi:uncharacterized protein LOC108939953 [Scleropages formosus]|uniref:uncharacterized protein LOC108939953 n=1 Tax=Scleropages formosus TaxID=113540 RepID=UPI0010FA9911|nr:uncharacterized protein LOC108939953 [Scleropages formosus]